MTNMEDNNNNTDTADPSLLVHGNGESVHLLDVPLSPATAWITSVTGSFAAAGAIELVGLTAGGRIECYRVRSGAAGASDDTDTTAHADNNRLQLICSTPAWSTLRSLAPIRLPGEARDVLAVTSDAGTLAVLDYSMGGSNTAIPRILHTTDLGKTGCRRSTPGQYVAADPVGRAVLVAAVEQRKLVYVCNTATSSGTSSAASASSAASSNNNNKSPTLTLASPLEAHRSRTITYAAVGLDRGFENPVFACLELQYDDTSGSSGGSSISNISNNNSKTPTKQVAYYELDLGLNHVARKWATAVPNKACCLAAVPGGTHGPGGVLVGAEDWILYVHDTLKGNNNSKNKYIACPIPRRTFDNNNTANGVLVTQMVVYRQKKSKFFGLAQSERGDVYKITLDVTKNNDADADTPPTVTGLHIAVLDTLPLANSLNVNKLGMLFAVGAFGAHNLYQFERIDLPDAATSHSQETQDSENADDADLSAADYCTTARAVARAPTFVPTTLRNVRRLCHLPNPSPTVGLLVGELAGRETSPQIYRLTGTGPSARLWVTRHGASVTELAVSDLPGVPGAIFTIPRQQESDSSSSNNTPFSEFIVVSFADATLVLQVGDTVEEVSTSGFLTNAPTLACARLLGPAALVQVHPTGVRHMHNGQTKQWHCPGLKRIETASANAAQVIVALAGGELVYFQVDPHNGNLTEQAQVQIGGDVCSVHVGPILPGASRSLWAAVGCRDQTVRILSLQPKAATAGKASNSNATLLQQKASTALKSRPHSVLLVPPPPSSGAADLTLVVGLDDGSSLRATVDPVTGSIIGNAVTRRFLGARPVELAPIPIDRAPGTLQLSSRPWIGRRSQTSGSGNNNAANAGKHILTPLSYMPLDHGCHFSSPAVPEGVVVTAGNTLRILSLDAAGNSGSDANNNAFHTRSVPLRYTPRQMTLMPIAGSNNDSTEKKVVLAVVEADGNAYGQDELQTMGFDPTGKKALKEGGKNDDDDAMDMDSDDEKAGGDNDDDDDDDDRQTDIRGPVPTEAGRWGSCVRLLDPSNACRTLDVVEMNKNEAAFCCCSVRFHSKGGEPLLAVGTVTGMKMHPLQQKESHIALYRIVNGDRFQLLHRTLVEDGPVLAMAHFQGRLLVGIGSTLRLYEMGKRQLLRKSELRKIPTFVKSIQTVEDRAFVGDMMQSVQIVRYDATANRLMLLANDPCPRPIVCQELLDWNTVAVADKFGNISVLRLPKGADVGVVDLTGQRALWDTSREDITPKLELLCQYHVGEVVTSMTRSSLVAGGADSLIYVTVTGRIGAMVPFTSRDDLEFYTALEHELRTEAPRPTGRDPKAFRSYYAPAMHVLDGSLCDAFDSLSLEKQQAIAERMDRTVGEISKKLEDARSSLL